MTVRRSFHGFNSHSRWQPTPFKRGSSLIRQVEGALVSIHLVNLNLVNLNLNVRRSFHGSTTEYSDLWYLLHELIESVTCRTRYPGNNYAFMTFSSPYPRVTDCDILTLAFLRLLENYVYTLDSTYSKVTLGYKMYFPPTSHDISCTLGKSIPVYDLSGALLKKGIVYDMIEGQVRLYGEKYEHALVKSVFLNGEVQIGAPPAYEGIKCSSYIVQP